MSRLYLRIFLSFWMVIILTIGSVLLINIQLERAQIDDTEVSERAQRMASGLSMRAQRALDRGGVDGLARWAEPNGRQHGGRRLAVFVFDEGGNELLERRPPREVRQAAGHWSDDGDIPQPQRRGQFITSISHPEHGQFLVVLNPPPRPAVLRIFGPLGLWGLIGVAVIISGLICLWLARTITRPLGQVRLAGQALGRGELDARSAPESTARRDEIGDLARDFNRMAERLQGLVDVQRQLLRDVSHELRSPLARLQVALTLLADAEDEAERQRHLARTEADLERLNHLIGEILGYARISHDFSPNPESIDLVDLLEDIAESARLEGAPRHISVKLDAPNTLPLLADPELLGRAIENIVRNALRHSPENGTILLGLSTESDTLTITVRDQGAGVPERSLVRIFEPFVRLSDERSETGASGGIGLAIARAAIEHHRGTIEARNHVNGGLEIIVRLPKTSQS